MNVCLCFIVSFVTAILFIESSYTALSEDQSATLMLVPWPKNIEMQAGTYTLSKSISIAFKGDMPNDSNLPDTFAEDLCVYGFKPKVIANAEDVQSGIRLILNKNEPLGKEAYRLSVTGDGITATAAYETGLFWATRTLLQLLVKGPEKAVPCLSIQDEPKLAYRGLLLDTARIYHDIEFLIETIKRLSSYKMNVLHIHFSDSQGYRLPSEKFPKLPSVAPKGERIHYTKEEIARLVDTAKKYHVVILPEIDIPAHAAALTAAMPDLLCDGHSGPNDELCIGKEKSYEILETIIGEVMEMIPGPYWHLGADEVNFAQWESCKDCKKRMADEKLENAKQLYHYFINRMNKFVKSKGRQMMVWEGFDPNGKLPVNQDIIVFPYDINLREGARPMDYLDAGYTVVNASWKPLYVVANMHVAEPFDLAKWHVYQFKGYHDDGKFGVYKMTEPWTVEPTPKIIGAQLCSWENNPAWLRGWLFNAEPNPQLPFAIKAAPRVQIVAERLWTGSSTEPEDLLRRCGIKSE